MSVKAFNQNHVHSPEESVTKSLIIETFISKDIDWLAEVLLYILSVE